MDLSIIIPVYNSEKYLESCIKTVVSDIDNNAEIIIINDGSTDSSLEICNKFKADNIKIYTNDNHGVSYSRNFGIGKARGNWIMFVDADDLLVNDWYRNIKCYFNSDYDFIAFSKDADDNRKYTKKEIVSYITGYETNDLNLSGVWSKLYNKRYLLENKILFDEKLINGEDMIFNIENVCLSNNYKIKKICMYKYRISYNSSTNRFNYKYIGADKNFHVTLDKLLKSKSNFDEEFIKDIENFEKQNAIIGIAYKLSLAEDYRIFKENKKVLEEYKNINYNFKKISKKMKLVLILIKLKLYYFVFLLFKIKKGKRRKKDEFKFI